MKCLLLAPMRYPFIHSIVSGMETQGIELRAVDYQDFFSPRINKRYNNYSALPRKIRKYWEEPYIRKTNESYLQIFREFAPDLVFIYNNQLVEPGLLEEFRKKPGLHLCLATIRCIHLRAFTTSTSCFRRITSSARTPCGGIN
ncbi:MAG: hypothetical protein IPJ40_22275 [Saprospirales bacterium]|nr:hypothetical protein [Saprospirales bacterium]